MNSALAAVAAVAAEPAAPLVATGAAAAQSALERSPNMEGIWSSRPGTLHFHFLHRFQRTDPPFRKVLNSPTFLLAAGLPGNVLLGGRYASNSQLVPVEPNEWEAFLRWTPLLEEQGGPLDTGVQAGWNGVAESVDGELMVGRSIGPVRLLAAGRAFSAYAGEDEAFALAGGGRLRLTRHIGLAADVARLLDRDDAETSWSAGVQLEIPYTPHSLSLHASNANTTTLQGSSMGSDEVLWGFEFTVPLTLSRYFGGDDAASTATGPGGLAVTRDGGGAARGGVRARLTEEGVRIGAVVDMDNRLRYLPDTVRVKLGEAVRWRNGSDLVHTVTADPERAALPSSVALPSGAEPFDSGDLAPGAEFVHVFDTAGEYRYFCVPHERAGMVGVVVVEP